jgi:hypothetical protein
MISDPASASFADSPARPPRLTTRVARVVTEVLAPAPVVAVLLFVIAWQSSSSPERALVWAGISILFASLIPISYVLHRVRQRRLSDRHVAVRRQRPLPLVVAIVSVLIGLAVLSAVGAPRTLVALVGAMGVGLTVSLAVTLFWKMSIHTAVVAGAVVILALVFGLVWLLLAPIVALVAWARVELGDHTPPQVLVGAALGAMVAAVMFPLLLGG